MEFTESDNYFGKDIMNYIIYLVTYVGKNIREAVTAEGLELDLESKGFRIQFKEKDYLIKVGLEESFPENLPENVIKDIKDNVFPKIAPVVESLYIKLCLGYLDENCLFKTSMIAYDTSNKFIFQYNTKDRVSFETCQNTLLKYAKIINSPDFAKQSKENRSKIMKQKNLVEDAFQRVIQVFDFQKDEKESRDVEKYLNTIPQLKFLVKEK